MNNSEELNTTITNATNKLNEARALNSSNGVQIAYEAALAAVNLFSSPCEYGNSGNKYYRHEFARNLKTLREYRKNEEKLRCASILANEKSDEKHFSTLRTIRIETMKLATALNAAKLYADKNSAISYNEKAEYLCNKAVEAFTQYCTLEYNSNEQITHEFRIAKYNRLAECWYEFNSPEDNGRILREKTNGDDRLFEYDSNGDSITISVELPNVSVFGNHDGKWFSNFYKLGTVEGDKFFNKFAEFDAKITAERIVEKAVKYAAESKAIARNTSENAAEAKATAEKAAAEAAADPDDVMKKAHANYYSDEAKKFAAYAEEVEKKAAEATKAAESYKLNVENKNNKENDMKNNNSNGLRSQNHKESKEEAEHRIAYAAFEAEMDADEERDAAKEAEKAAKEAEKAANVENKNNNNNKENNMKNKTITTKDRCVMNYDANGKLQHIKKAYGEERWYENCKRTITKYSANADGTETWYDFSGKLIRSKDSDGLETGYEYNANGKLIHEKNSNKEEVWYEYDADGNEIHEKYSTGYEEWYDAYGNPVHEKWSSGDEVFLDRDANGDLVHKKILPEGEEIWYTSRNGGHIINSESSRKEYYWKEENGITVYCETEYGEYKEADDFFPTNYINDAFSI